MNKIEPNYYKDRKVQTIDAIESQLSPEEFKGYLKGNVIKYISRSGKKFGSPEVEDMKKAQWYLKRILSTLETDELTQGIQGVLKSPKDTL